MYRRDTSLSLIGCFSTQRDLLDEWYGYKYGIIQGPDSIFVSVLHQDTNWDRAGTGGEYICVWCNAENGASSASGLDGFRQVLNY